MFDFAHQSILQKELMVFSNPVSSSRLLTRSSMISSSGFDSRHSQSCADKGCVKVSWKCQEMNSWTQIKQECKQEHEVWEFKFINTIVFVISWVVFKFSKVGIYYLGTYVIWKSKLQSIQRNTHFPVTYKEVPIGHKRYLHINT